ncbi:MAG: hypothetical protein A2W01_10165 [Candidatus Solincola sediminis]|nr:MAG: hypothetical protein A2W01_10165 [Candidatus Solincola sediminis]
MHPSAKYQRVEAEVTPEESLPPDHGYDGVANAARGAINIKTISSNKRGKRNIRVFFCLQPPGTFANCHEEAGTFLPGRASLTYPQSTGPRKNPPSFRGLFLRSS